LKEQSSVAVVILNWNGMKFLEDFLPSVCSSTYENLQIIVADNHSTDDSRKYLLANGFEPYKAAEAIAGKKYLIELPDNYGFAKGYNLAIEQINTDYSILLNSDVEVSPGWIEPIIKMMDKDPQIAATMPKILMQSQKNLFEYAGAAGGWIDSYGYPFCRGRIFGNLEEDHAQYDNPCEVFWASGAAFFVRTELFNKIGGFDADYFAHMEEIDLCWRLKKANYKIIFCPESTVWHVGAGTLQVESPKKVYLNFRNSLSTILKNKESALSAISTVFIRLLLDGVAALMFLTKGKFSHIGAIVKAHWHFFAKMGRDWKKRNKNLKTIKALAFDNCQTLNNKGIYNKSIVFQHFVKKISKFSDLNIDDTQ
jgi:GT2 family glycosyltransferase